MNTSEGQRQRGRCFGHMERRDCVYIGQKKTELGGKTERPQRRLTCVVKEDMQIVCVTEEDSRDWMKWRQMIYCDDP